jgi:hypothetical protein
MAMIAAKGRIVGYNVLLDGREWSQKTLHAAKTFPPVAKRMAFFRPTSHRRC